MSPSKQIVWCFSVSGSIVYVWLLWGNGLRWSLLSPLRFSFPPQSQPSQGVWLCLTLFQSPKYLKSLPVFCYRHGKHCCGVRSGYGCLFHTKGEASQLITAWLPEAPLHKLKKEPSQSISNIWNTLSRILGPAKEGLPPPLWGFLTAEAPNLATLSS